MGGGGGGGGVKGLCATVHPVGGSGGMPPPPSPEHVLNFRPSEINSGAFSDHFCFSNDMR